MRVPVKADPGYGRWWRSDDPVSRGAAIFVSILAGIALWWGLGVALFEALSH